MSDDLPCTRISRGILAEGFWPTSTLFKAGRLERSAEDNSFETASQKKQALFARLLTPIPCGVVWPVLFGPAGTLQKLRVQTPTCVCSATCVAAESADHM